MREKLLYEQHFREIGFKGKDLNEYKIEEVDCNDRSKEKVQRE